jgi:GNAT superfamily N-acetyltransferase
VSSLNVDGSSVFNSSVITRRGGHGRAGGTRGEAGHSRRRGAHRRAADRARLSGRCAGRGRTGRALVVAAEQVARAWGCLQIEVTSRRSRADAHAFYRQQGFTDVCERSGRFIKEL